MPVKIRTLLEKIQSVNAGFDTFKVVLINTSASVLERVDKAIATMYELALSDFELIKNIIQRNKATYTLVYSKDLGVSGPLYPYLKNTLKSNEFYCDSDRYNKSVRLLLGRMQIATFHTQNTMQYQDLLKKARTPGCPGQLWTRHHSKPDCQASLEYIIKTMNNVSVSASFLCPSNRITETEIDMHWVWAKECLNEYSFSLQHAEHGLIEITNQINKNLKSIFNYDKVLRKITHVRIVYEMAERVASLFASYSQHQITKLDVANFFIDLQFAEDYDVYDRIFWTLEKYAFGYFMSKIDTMEQNMQSLFGDAFRVIELLMPYCDIEQRVRNLSLWRYPLARLDVQDIISFKYNSDDSWKSWSQTVSLKEMIDTHLGEAILKDIVESYSNVLRGSILEIKSEFTKSVSQIKSSIGLLVEDLEIYQKDNTINSDFILWVFSIDDSKLISIIFKPLLILAYQVIACLCKLLTLIDAKLRNFRH